MSGSKVSNASLAAFLRDVTVHLKWNKNQAMLSINLAMIMSHVKPNYLAAGRRKFTRILCYSPFNEVRYSTDDIPHPLKRKKKYSKKLVIATCMTSPISLKTSALDPLILKKLFLFACLESSLK